MIRKYTFIVFFWVSVLVRWCLSYSAEFVCWWVSLCWNRLCCDWDCFGSWCCGLPGIWIGFVLLVCLLWLFDFWHFSMFLLVVLQVWVCGCSPLLFLLCRFIYKKESWPSRVWVLATKGKNVYDSLCWAGLDNFLDIKIKIKKDPR